MSEKRFSYIRSLSTLFYILLGGQFLLAASLFLLVHFDYLELYPWENFSGGLSILGVSVFVVCRYASVYLYKRRIEQIVHKDSPMKKKMEDYTKANIQRWSVMGFAIFSSIILDYLSGNKFLMILTVFMVLLFILMRPTSTKTIDELDIDVEKYR